MTIKIKLKDNIDDILNYDEETQTHFTDFIALSPEVKAMLGTSLEVELDLPRQCDIDEGDNSIQLGIPDSEFVIHPSWVAKCEGYKAAIDETLNGNYVKLNSKVYYDIQADAIIPKSDVSVCTSCNAPLEDSSEELCNHCLEEKYYKKYSYSYKPTFEFIGKQKGKHAKHNPIWYGVELEFGTKAKIKMAKLLKANPKVYAKDDSSIRGPYCAELVSHPHSFDALKAKDSWIQGLSTLDAEDHPDSNGCHIHVSRTAFKSDQHYAKFKYLLHSNLELLEYVGGRKLNSYCEPYAPKHELFTIQKDDVKGERRSLCNESNKHTIELRFMASSNSPSQVLSYIEYLDSMIKYTAYHTTSATYNGYMKYIIKYSDTYNNILSRLQENKVEISGSVSYKKPKLYEMKLADMPASRYKNIVSMYTTNTKNNSKRDLTMRANVDITVNSNGRFTSINHHNIEPNETVYVRYMRGA